MNSLTQKYPHLEISVLKLSEVKKHFILGAEFNSTKRQQALHALKSNKKVLDYFDLIKSDTPQANEAVYVYDLTHSLGNFLDEGEVLNAQNFGSNKQEAQAGDFVISRLRSYLQEMAVVQPKLLRQFFSTEYLIYRPRTQELSSNTLMIFALSRYVQTILAHSQYGTEHPRFYEFAFNEMPIPDAIFRLNSKIHHMVETAHACLEQSKALYKEAQGLLEQELGTPPKAPPKEHQIKSLKESFLSTGRLDAEFYQSKYAQIEDLLKNYKGGVCTLEDFEICDAPFEPQPNTTYRYVELAHIGNYGNILTPTETLGAHLPTRARRLAQSGDVLLSSVAGSLSRCALVPASLSPCVVSTGFFVLRSKRFNPETLLTLFKSPLFQAYLTKFPSGTILCALSKSVLHSVLLPKIPLNVQEQIATLLQESLAHRQEAKSLLVQARTEVEGALSREREREIAKT
ncbi:restriction endonuclease subunit S [Helicobacter ailurogastricus]|uniref:restriction endonuclease subunit S n=1 Tax=Helicobacter ailurogastricus TaxID=1578720 RepID=UPI000CF0D3B9|nr:restriction endonuclease subunit S [Helicobacter ailurogastricus]